MVELGLCLALLASNIAYFVEPNCLYIFSTDIRFNREKWNQMNAPRPMMKQVTGWDLSANIEPTICCRMAEMVGLDARLGKG